MKRQQLNGIHLIYCKAFWKSRLFVFALALKYVFKYVYLCCPLSCSTIASSVGTRFMHGQAENSTSRLSRRVLIGPGLSHSGGVDNFTHLHLVASRFSILHIKIRPADKTLSPQAHNFSLPLLKIFTITCLKNALNMVKKGNNVLKRMFVLPKKVLPRSRDIPHLISFSKSKNFCMCFQNIQDICLFAPKCSKGFTIEIQLM